MGLKNNLISMFFFILNPFQVDSDLHIISNHHNQLIYTASTVEMINLNDEKLIFKNKTILIDPGHGGHDVGAIGISNTFEKDLTYRTAEELQKILSSLGANVITTRNNDEFISLNARTAFSNMEDIDVFISIHYNSFPEEPNVSGIETYYYHDQHLELAKHIQRGLIEKTKAKDRGISKGDYVVLRQNFKPAVLLELGFISNKESEEMIHSTYYQEKLISGIITGLKNYFTNNEV